MAERGLHYAYTQLSSEAPAVTKGMWEFAQDYTYTHFGAEETARAERNQVRMLASITVANASLYSLLRGGYPDLSLRYPVARSSLLRAMKSRTRQGFSSHSLDGDHQCCTDTPGLAVRSSPAKLCRMSHMQICTCLSVYTKHRRYQ